MISVTCPSCGAKLNAKDQLAGETRKCPKCGQPVLITRSAAPPEPAGQASPGPDESAPDAQIHGATKTALQKLDVPERLDRQNHYLICDKIKLVATWENNGQSWMFKTNFGMVSAARNHEQLPTQGDFKLVELQIDMTDAGLRLAGMVSYQLAPRWALTQLDKGDDKVVSKITAPGSLNKDQKGVVRNVIKDRFMRQVWQDAQRVLDYLANTDYHSPGTE